MQTYIITWNPKRWKQWTEKEYNNEVAATKKGRLFPSRWSCGNTKRIVPGDRLFLLRQVAERGIIGSGYATSKVFEDEHWDSSRKDEIALYVDYQSDTLLPVHERLPIEQLEAADLGVHWNYMPASGISVPEKSALQLERLWKEHLVRIGWHTIQPITYPEESPNHKYVEGATHKVVMDAYERDPKARAECLSHYGKSCVVCRLTFADFYGELGEDYIHVHHLRDLAQIKRSHKVDPIKDLRPVCPNCHAMLHQTKPAMPIKKLQDIVRKQARRRK
ncbi:MAG: HNH endonuclease [Pirellulales bacterium]|nr:HNH endonuclease [Pirellulales bacterium]